MERQTQHFCKYILLGWTLSKEKIKCVKTICDKRRQFTGKIPSIMTSCALWRHVSVLPVSLSSSVLLFFSFFFPDNFTSVFTMHRAYQPLTPANNIFLKRLWDEKFFKTHRRKVLAGSYKVFVRQFLSVTSFLRSFCAELFNRIWWNFTHLQEIVRLILFIVCEIYFNNPWPGDDFRIVYWKM